MMVDHVKTLLLNRSYVDASGIAEVSWMIDVSFVPVVLDRVAQSFRDSLFINVPGYDIAAQADRVNAVASLVLVPENRGLQKLLDPRVTDVERVPSSVFEFYGSISSEPANPGFVGAVLGNGVVSSVFNVPEGVSGDISAVIGEYRVKWESSHETPTKFTSAVSAYVLRLEALRLRGIGKGS